MDSIFMVRRETGDRFVLFHFILIPLFSAIRRFWARRNNLPGRIRNYYIFLIEKLQNLIVLLHGTKKQPCLFDEGGGFTRYTMTKKLNACYDFDIPEFVVKISRKRFNYGCIEREYQDRIL
jgi:hypothetical protein